MFHDVAAAICKNEIGHSIRHGKDLVHVISKCNRILFNGEIHISSFKIMIFHGNISPSLGIVTPQFQRSLRR
jgi:hypothetical protein